MNRGKLEHILAYARQQKQFGSPTCRIPPGDMVEIMERLLAKPVSSGYTLNSPVIPDGWIACSERMPEIEDEYYLTFSASPFGGGVSVDFFFDGYFADQNITHWMPLPAAPEGGNDHDTRR